MKPPPEPTLDNASAGNEYSSMFSPAPIHNMTINLHYRYTGFKKIMTMSLVRLNDKHKACLRKTSK